MTQLLVARTIFATSIGKFTPVGLLWDPDTEDFTHMEGRKLAPQKFYEVNGYADNEVRELSKMILAEAYPALKVISSMEYDDLYASLSPQRRTRWEQGQKAQNLWTSQPIGESFAHRRPSITGDGGFVTRVYNPCNWAIAVPNYGQTTLAGLPPSIVIPPRTYLVCVHSTVAIIAKWKYVEQAEPPAWWYEYAGECDGYELHESGEQYDVVCPTPTAMGRVYS